ncbi:MAG: S8 family peptidase [Spirochaetales bacterium]|nr:S8 family peptidase [Spirochaetales bacterium]
MLKFPERAVKLVKVTRAELSQITQQSDDIAEYRKAKTTAEFWVTMSNREQAEWVEDLLNRCEIEPDSQIAVCLLDTGVNNGHPLLNQIISIGDCQSVISEWGKQDDQNHGTPMAGLAAYGNLIKKATSNQNFKIKHRLESVKIIPPANHPDTPPELWGLMTKQAASLAEIQNPEKVRILCMALTAPDKPDSGRPSSWSAALDQLCAGADDGQRHLLILSSGNSAQTATLDECGVYPQTQKNVPVQDPAQAWNVLTIGSFTELTDITDPSFKGWQPVAPKEGLSPFSTTSLVWDDRWPIKPEIVMEGGNLAKDEIGNITECDDLNLLSTNKNFQTNLFTSFSMTSASAALASNFAAQLQADYPNYWPETIRALMIHSAGWTDEMARQFRHGTNKEHYQELLRTCGYGIPNLEKARYSASNSLTLIAESQIQPFYKKDGRSDISTKEMHLYNLPWPREELLNIPDEQEVSMRITLSYFIEPGPGEMGWEHRYRYPSFGLRFYLNSPNENADQFQRRINTIARDEEHGHPGTTSASEHWTIGKYRNHGSVHSDIWNGTAQELASSNLIAVYPVTGWWKERKNLEQWTKSTRYSLIVSIETTDVEVDLYTPVAIKLSIPISIKTQI